MAELKLEQNQNPAAATTMSVGVVSSVKIDASFEVKGSLELPSSDYAVASSFLEKAARAGIQISLVGGALKNRGYAHTVSVTEASFRDSAKLGEVAVGAVMTMAYQWTCVGSQALLEAPSSTNLLSNGVSSALPIQTTPGLPKEKMVEMSVIIRSRDSYRLPDQSRPTTDQYTHVLAELNKRS